eukprot:TRINITY_DN29879_c1_g1_i1.p1 TRINITY_DN29879_c1_g1~~TRINITY_DN29879_c1_g1_i1.p1  ORF type:complete len:239 (-),score=49.91 TRINITY_DN29879_c1_g1_i1:139-855(-)
MHSFTLQMQSHPFLMDPALFNSKPPTLYSSTTLSKTPQSYNTRNPNLSFRISHLPQKPITIISAQRKNQKRRSPWRQVVEKCISHAASNLGFMIPTEPLNLILDDGGFGGGGFGVGRKKKGFGGGFERRWELGVVGFLVWVLWLVLGRCGDFGFWSLVPALLESWIRVLGRRRKWGLEIWCCVMGVLVVMVGLRRDERLERRIVEVFRDWFSVLASAFKRRRRGGGGGGGRRRRRRKI